MESKAEVFHLVLRVSCLVAAVFAGEAVDCGRRFVRVILAGAFFGNRGAGSYDADGEGLSVGHAVYERVLPGGKVRQQHDHRRDFPGGRGFPVRPALRRGHIVVRDHSAGMSVRVCF